MSNQRSKGESGSSDWAWWTGGVLLVLVYLNYSGRDHRPEPSNAVVGMSARETLAYRSCMRSSGPYNLSGAAQSDLCRKSALGVGGGQRCHVDWDGRSNPTVCE